MLYSVEREEKVVATGSLSRSERKVRSSAVSSGKRSMTLGPAGNPR